MRLEWVLIVVGLAIPLGFAGLLWRGQSPVAPKAAELGEPVEAEPVGTVHTSVGLEREWTSWQGGYKLFASGFAGIREEADLHGRQLLVPSFTLASVGVNELQLVRHRAASFAAMAGMTVAEESRSGYFRARVLSEQQSVALVPNAVAEALGLSSAPGLIRLLPSTLKEKGGA